MYNFKPILGIVINGKYKDFKFVLKSTKEINKYFGTSGVYRVLNGKIKTHRGCIFERITEEESKKYKVKVTKKILNSVK